MFKALASKYNVAPATAALHTSQMTHNNSVIITFFATFQYKQHGNIFCLVALILMNRYSYYSYFILSPFLFIKLISRPKLKSTLLFLHENDD